MEAGDRNVSLLTENIAGVHVVRAFATEPDEIAKCGRNCDAFLWSACCTHPAVRDSTPVVRASRWLRT